MSTLASRQSVAVVDVRQAKDCDAVQTEIATKSSRTKVRPNSKLHARVMRLVPNAFSVHGSHENLNFASTILALILPDGRLSHM